MSSPAPEQPLDLDPALFIRTPPRDPSWYALRDLRPLHVQVRHGIERRTRCVVRSWPAHNLLAHPLSELLHWAGLGSLGGRLHDRTLPEHEPGTGRG